MMVEQDVTTGIVSGEASASSVTSGEGGGAAMSEGAKRRGVRRGRASGVGAKRAAKRVMGQGSGRSAFAGGDDIGDIAACLHEAVASLRLASARLKRLKSLKPVDVSASASSKRSVRRGVPEKGGDKARRGSASANGVSAKSPSTKAGRRAADAVVALLRRRRGSRGLTVSEVTAALTEYSAVSLRQALMALARNGVVRRLEGRPYRFVLAA